MQTPAWFRNKRGAAGLTQRDVADAMGVHTSTYSRMEAGVIPTPPDRLAVFLRLIAQHRPVKDAEVQAQDATRPMAELISELAAITDGLRAIGLELQAGGDPVALNKIGHGLIQRMGQIANALLARAPVVGGPQ